MLEWILEKLPVVIFVVVFLGQLVRGILKTRGARTEAPPRHDHLEEERRTKQIQEEIRRKIAERRAAHAPQTMSREPAEESHQHPEPPPPVVVRRDPTAIPLPDQMGEPLKRMLQQLERKLQPAPAEPPVMAESRAAELARQQQLADEMRALEEARLAAQRRAARIAAATAREAESEAGLRRAARGRVLDDLRDPESLRRAFILREVLGTPVGLR